MVPVDVPVLREDAVIEEIIDRDGDGEREAFPVSVCDIVAGAVAAVEAVSDANAVGETVGEAVESVDTEDEKDGDGDVDRVRGADALGSTRDGVAAAVPASAAVADEERSPVGEGLCDCERYGVNDE